jgi:hypothetical protein
LVDDPTAIHLELLGHDIESNWLVVEPLGVGVVTTCHELPFHLSANPSADAELVE